MHIYSSKSGKSHLLVVLLTVATCVLLVSCSQTPRGYVPQSKCPALTASKLLVELPDICPTPDGMAMDKHGNIIVACPNYGDQSKPAVLMKIGKDNKASLWAHVPTHPDTGVACPMGIDFGPDGDLFVCDNQGWVKANDKGRILRLRIRNGQVVKSTVVADGMAHPNGIRVHRGRLYVTQSMMPKVESEQLVSGVYRFDIDDENVQIENALEDDNLLLAFKTLNID